MCNLCGINSLIFFPNPIASVAYIDLRVNFPRKWIFHLLWRKQVWNFLSQKRKGNYFMLKMWGGDLARSVYRNNIFKIHDNHDSLNYFSSTVSTLQTYNNNLFKWNYLLDVYEFEYLVMISKQVLLLFHRLYYTTLIP